VLAEVMRTGKLPSAIVEEQGLAQVSDSGELDAAVLAALSANPAAVADYQAGKGTAINFLKGQVMKATRGKANPTVVEDLLRQHLGQ
jgi:aspartyl-tRNA(Asn)/glutamyl-tRNA(Gln) amidotransferase subunit B